MAQLKDTIVSGNLRVTDTTLTDTLQVTTIKAPTSSGGTTYGPGTNGQVLKSNGTTTYWASDSNSDVNVTQTATTTDAAYEVLFSNTADNTTRTETARKNSNLKFNPSTGSLYATIIYAGGAESQSAYPAGGYHVYDCRSVDVTPSDGNRTANFYFHMTGTPDTSKWWSVMHVKGWTGAYSSWQLAGPAHNSDQRTTPLYVRTSNINSAWGSWRKIYDTANKPTASEIGALSSSTTYALSTSVGGNAILADGLAMKTLTAETLDTTTGSFVFKGDHLLGATYDWAGLQVDASNDAFQLMANGQLMIRQNDGTSKTSENWGEWKGCLLPSNVVGSGGITVTQDDIIIGTGDDAFSYKGAVTISHTNSITEETSTVFKKFSYDGNGHITGVANVLKADITALGIPAQDTKYGISGAYGANSNTWVTTITAGGTGTTSTVPTASTSAYGITKLYDGVDSTSTSLAATANAVKAAYDKGNHSHPYLPLSGGTMTGPLTMKANQYSGTYGLDMNNSDIIGANRIVFADLADSYTEGLAFYRTTTDNVKIYDNFWIKDGVMYFTPNAPTATTNYTVLHTGNLSTYVKASTNNGKLSVNGSDVTVYTHPTKTAQSTSDFYKITVDDTGHVTTGDALTAANLPSHTHTYTVPPSAFAVQTGSTKQSHITLQTLMTWLITTKAYITSGANRSLTLCTTWSYADNDILQLSINGVNYELQLAGVIIEFDGAATSYNAGTFRLRIHSSPTLSFTPASGYTKFPASHVAEYTCNGSSYSPTWKMFLDSTNTSFTQTLTSGTKIGSITIAGSATDIYAPTNTDTKVTSSDNHYTPATASGSDKTASASGATAAWSIDVVKGVTLNTDGKGHVTGISVTSGKIPANPVPSNNVTGSGTSGYLTKWDGTNTITNGPQLGSSTTTFLRNDGSWATPTDTDEKVKVDLFTSTTQTDYMIAGATAAMATTAAHLVIDTADGVASARIRLQKGTTSAVGQAMLMLGNNITSGTAKNMQGSILMYASTAYYGKINAAALTDNRTWTMPNKTGTVALTSDIPSLSVTSSGTGPVVTGMSYSSGVLTYTKGRVLSTSGGQWIAGRDNAPVLANSNSSTAGSFYPMGAVKTNTGAWAIGALGNGDSLVFSFSTDTNYSGGTNTTNNYYIGTDGAFTGTAAGLTAKTLTAETFGTTNGSFVFKGTSLFGGTDSYDWVGIQADASNDMFQLVGGGNNGVFFREKDDSSGWSAWYALLTNAMITGSSGITVTPTTFKIGGDDGTTINGAVTIAHSNSITAQTSTVFTKFSYDACGHITDVAAVVKADIPQLDYIGAKTDGSYWGMATPANDDTQWIRTTKKGIIPYQARAASATTTGDGNACQLGTSSWYFASSYIQYMYGTAEKADRLKANSTVTDTTGVQYARGGITVGTADGNAAEGSNASYKLWSYPAGGTSVSGGVANIQNLRLYWSSTYFRDIFISPNNYDIYHRSVANGTAYAWRKILDSTNYTDYTVTKTGTGATGSWGIDITGSAATLSPKTLTAETLDTTDGSFVFKGTNLLGAVYDWVGFQADASNDKFQILANNQLMFRQIDSTTWSDWVGCITPNNVSAASGIKVTATTTTVGTGTTAFTYNSGVKIEHDVTISDDSTSTGTLTHGGTFTAITSVTRDSYGHVTTLNTKTYTLPASGNTDTKVNVTLGTTTKAYLLGTSTTPTSTAQAVTSIADTGVYLDTTSGRLTATTFKGGLYSYNPASDQTLSNAYPTYTVAYFAYSGAYGGSTGRTGNSGSNYWAHYLTFTHSDRNYRYLLRFPYWGPPQYQRTIDGTNQRWCNFITDEHIGNYSRDVGTSRPIDPITGAMTPVHRANKLAFLPAANITVQMSADAGSTWSDYAVTDDLKRQIFTLPVRNSSINIGPSGNVSTSMQTRILVEFNDRDAVLDRFMFQIGSGYHKIGIDVYAGTTIDGLTKIATGDFAYNWDYEAVLTLDHNIDKFYRFSSSNYKYLAFVFRYVTPNTSHLTEKATINGISGYSGSYWGNDCNSNLANFDHLYSWDIDQNAYFPADIYIGSNKVARSHGSLNTAIGSASTAANTKTFFDTDAVPIKDVSVGYNSSGSEFAFLFAKGNSNSYGTVLKWGYAEKYIYMLRKQGGTWKSTDWEKISAGYADSAGTVSTESDTAAGARPVFYAGLSNTSKVVYNSNFTYNPSGGILQTEQLALKSGSYTTTIEKGTTTANRTLVLPDTSGGIGVANILFNTPTNSTNPVPVTGCSLSDYDYFTIVISLNGSNSEQTSSAIVPAIAGSHYFLFQILESVGSGGSMMFPAGVVITEASGTVSFSVGVNRGINIPSSGTSTSIATPRTAYIKMIIGHKS